MLWGGGIFFLFFFNEMRQGEQGSCFLMYSCIVRERLSEKVTYELRYERRERAGKECPGQEEEEQRA